MSGLSSSTNTVALQYVPAADRGIAFVIIFGWAQWLLAAKSVVIVFAWRRQWPKWHWSASWCVGRPQTASLVLTPSLPPSRQAGLACGALWALGNVGATVATLSPLGLTVGYPLVQTSLLVAGLWGLLRPYQT